MKSWNKFLILVCFSGSVYAARPERGMLAGGGDFIDFIVSFVDKALILVAIGMIFASLMQYREYRLNPAHVKLSKPITLFLVGCSLYGLTYIPMSGV